MCGIWGDVFWDSCIYDVFMFCIFYFVGDFKYEFVWIVCDNIVCWMFMVWVMMFCFVWGFGCFNFKILFGIIFEVCLLMFLMFESCMFWIVMFDYVFKIW